MKRTRFVKVKVGDGEQISEVVKENARTRLVQLPDGNVIKRHKVKHRAEAHEG